MTTAENMKSNKNHKKVLYIAANKRAWRDFMGGRVTVVELERRLLAAWIEWKGGRRWWNSLSPQEKWKEQAGIVADVNTVLKGFKV